MTVSVADVDRWDAGDVREVFNATRSRAEAAFEAADGVAELPAFGTWGGDASEAAEEAIGQTRRDLDAHGQEALAVAQAASKAADGIDAVKSSLAQLRNDAIVAGFEVDPIGSQVLRSPRCRSSSSLDPSAHSLSSRHCSPSMPRSSRCSRSIELAISPSALDRSFSSLLASSRAECWVKLE